MTLQTGEKLSWNNEEIEQHIKSAVDTLTPDIFDRIDLSVPQERRQEEPGQETPERKSPKVIRMSRRLRAAAMLVAACLCLLIGIGSFNFYTSRRVDSVIGIDVNPSIEIQVNRDNRVLSAKAINSDGEDILDGMDLRNVDMDIAVNAVIGSMVRHGYFDELENAILVTVSNKDSEKASLVRQDVVSEIETSLEEHNVNAIVYNQEAEETDELRQLADKYGISYGKAYFLNELVKENGLSDEDMAHLAGMTMEEIARYISEKSLSVTAQTGNDAPIETEVVTAPETESPSADTAADPSAEESVPESASSSAEGLTESCADTSAAEQTARPSPAAETAAESSSETQEEIASGTIGIDDADYDGEILTVTFDSDVTWKSASVSIEDEDGDSYPAKIVDTDSTSCEIEVTDLPGGVKCRFTIAGVSAKGSGRVKSVSGTFDTPEIADGAEENSYRKNRRTDADDEETETSAESTAAVTTAAPESSEGF
jgi:hypothetical protein